MRRRRIRMDRVIIALLALILVIVSVVFLIKGVISLFDRDDVEPVDNKDKEVEVVKQNTYDYTVILDPGHGGYDGGTVNGDLYEKDIVLKLANEVRNKLEEEGNIKVVLTRETDTCLNRDKDTDLAMRAAFSKEYNADCFVSIHVNSFETTTIKGMEIFKKDEDSASLAQNIMDELMALELTESRGIFDQSGLMVLRENTTKSVLVETGYISGDDYYYLRDDNQLNRIAHAIAKGIIKELKQ